MRRWFSNFLRGRPFSRTNRRWWAGVAEAVLAAGLLLSGVILLVVSLTLAVLYSSPQQLYISARFFALELILAGALIGIGSFWIARLLWHVGVSAERRGAITTRANELELLNEIRQRREDLPTVPRDHYLPHAGRVLKFRIVPSPRNVWGLATAGVFSVVFVGMSTILVLMTAMAFRNEEESWLDKIEKRIGENQLGSFPDQPWMIVALLIPIGLAAGWAIYQFFRQLIKLTGIGPTSIELSKYPLLPGETYQVFLSQAGRVRLKLLDVTLVCLEEATFNQGTDIRTEQKTVFQHRLIRRRGVSLRPRVPFETEFELKIPDDSMHSFKSQNNRVQWKIVVTGQAKVWPRLKRQFSITVHPSAPAASRAIQNP